MSAACAKRKEPSRPSSPVAEPLPPPPPAPANGNHGSGEADTSPPAASSSIDAFPPALLQWLSTHQIDPSLYVSTPTLPRYVRINPRNPLPVTALSSALGVPLLPTPLPSIYAVPPTTSLSTSAPYKAGQLYGIDLASALSVHALSLPSSSSPPLSSPLHVLDLCAAPGAKLSYLYDLLSSSCQPFSLTGVDCSLPRLSACRNLCKKYKLRGVRLCLADGRTFALPPPSSTTLALPLSGFVLLDLSSSPTPTLRLTKQQRRAHRRRHPPQPSPDPPPAPGPVARYQRVLVDAECSHDASVRHVLKFERWGWDTWERRFLGKGRLEGLQALQRALVERGWQLLDEGGVLVYSVCSGLREQGEDVVEWLLDHVGGEAGGMHLAPVFGEGEAVEVGGEAEQAAQVEGEAGEGGRVKWRWKRAAAFHHRSERQEGVRLDPATSGTSGMFVAKVVKRAMQRDAGSADESA